MLTRVPKLLLITTTSSLAKPIVTKPKLACQFRGNARARLPGHRDDLVPQHPQLAC
jgi:hypothetical protein